MALYISGTGQRVIVHSEKNCSGTNCVIHCPSSHHMNGWPTNWRDDIGMMERICIHGVGHPDPDDIKFKADQGAGGPVEWLGIHGCDGCCNKNTVEVS